MIDLILIQNVYFSLVLLFKNAYIYGIAANLKIIIQSAIKHTYTVYVQCICRYIKKHFKYLKLSLLTNVTMIQNDSLPKRTNEKRAISFFFKKMATVMRERRTKTCIIPKGVTRSVIKV